MVLCQCSACLERIAGKLVETTEQTENQGRVRERFLSFCFEDLNENSK